MYRAALALSVIIVWAAAVAPSAAASIAFTAVVVDKSKPTFFPKLSSLKIVGDNAIVDVAVTSPPSFSPSANFTAIGRAGHRHSLAVMKSTIRDGVLYARIKIATSASAPEQIDLCLHDTNKPELCGNIMVEHLY